MAPVSHSSLQLPGSGAEQKVFRRMLNNNVFFLTKSDTTMYGGCYSNRLGGNCFYNTILACPDNDPNVSGNIYGNDINSDFYFNTVGDDFHGNRIGSGARYNVLDNGFAFNDVGNNFNGNAVVGYTQNCSFGNYVDHITLKKSSGTSGIVEYAHVSHGVKNKTITIDGGLNYDVVVRMNGAHDIILD